MMLALRVGGRGPASQADSAPIPAATVAALHEVVLGALVAAALSELLFLRVTSRVGVHIPKDEPFLAVYRVLTSYGDFAFNVAVLLTAAAAGLLAYRLASGWRASFVRSVLLPALFGTLLLGAALLAATGAGAPLRLAFGAVSCAALLTVLALAWQSPARSPRVALLVTLAIGALLLGQYHVLGQAALEAIGSTASLPLATAVLGPAEALVLAAGAVAFWAWFPSKRLTSYRLELAAASLASLVLIGAFVREPSTTSILSLWTSGMTMYLPFPLYLASFWLYSATVAYTLRRARLRTAGVGLVLLLASGLLLETTYQHLLAAVALTLLALGPAWAARQNDSNDI